MDQVAEIPVFKVLGMGGSFRKQSWNTKQLKASQAIVPAGMQLDILEWGDVPVSFTAGKVICIRLQVACHRCTAVTRLQTEYLQAAAQIKILAGRFQFWPALANIAFAGESQLYICDMVPATVCRSPCQRCLEDL